jgi:hypothetical protein
MSMSLDYIKRGRTTDLDYSRAGLALLVRSHTGSQGRVDDREARNTGEVVRLLGL